MSTSSAVEWIRLASLCGCMRHISTSSSGLDPEPWALCLVGLLWGVTLKADLKWAVKMFLMFAVLYGRAGLGVQLCTRANCSVALITCFTFSDREFGLPQNLCVNRLATYWSPSMGTRCELFVNCMWLPVYHLETVLITDLSAVKLYDYVPNGQCELCMWLGF